MKISTRIGRICGLALVAAALAAPAASAGPDDVRGRPDGFQPQLRGDQPPSVTSAEPREISVHGVQGFDWSDAGVGAAVAFGALLLGAGTVLAVRSRRRVAHP